MGEEETFPSIQCFDGSHIFFAQGKIKDLEILFHPVFVDGFGNDNHIALKQKTQGGLGSCFSIAGADGSQYGVGEQIVSTFRKGSPGFDLTAVLFHIFFGGLLLLEYMGFHLDL